MLKNIDPLLIPELPKVLCEMGHGDEIVLAEANFTAASLGRGRHGSRWRGAAGAVRSHRALRPLRARGSRLRQRAHRRDAGLGQLHLQEGRDHRGFAGMRTKTAR